MTSVPYTHPLRGFTLVELMVTLAIAAILLSIAMPDMIRATRGMQLMHLAKEMEGAIKLTRAEAIRRGQTVVMCRLNVAQTDCNTGSPSADWSFGWMVFTDINLDNKYNTATEVGTRLLIKPAVVTAAEQKKFLGTSVVTPGGSPMEDRIIFNGAGELAGGFGGQFTFAHSSVGATSNAYLIINATGRVRVLDNAQCNADESCK
jgi:type IV fimbrial biogenesis protein FimT